MTIKDYLTLNIADLKRLGYLDRAVTKSGYLNWSCDGKVFASAGISASTADLPFVCLSYTFNGVGQTVNIPLRYKPSNLGTSGYYYFVCPITGRSCRKLYLVGGMFMGRCAFNPLYDQQAKSHKQRTSEFEFMGKYIQLLELTGQRYRRETYKGKPTPFGRKCMKLYNQVAPFLATYKI